MQFTIIMAFGEYCKENIRLTMVRETAMDIPQYALTNGFSVRWYQPGDETAWLEIQSKADIYNKIEPGLFQTAFGETPGELKDRQCFLLNSNKNPIGTATAWFNNDFKEKRYGRLHWIAIVPEMRGRGLAKPLLTHVCNRLLNLGHSQSYLTTSSKRLRAIKLYLKFGFNPNYDCEQEELVWKSIYQKLNVPFDLDRG